MSISLYRLQFVRCRRCDRIQPCVGYTRFESAEGPSNGSKESWECLILEAFEPYQTLEDLITKAASGDESEGVLLEEGEKLSQPHALPILLLWRLHV